jgi:hypothetical protein
VPTIFEKLGKGRPLPIEAMGKQLPRRREDPKIFLKDILAAGPVPVTVIEERGAARGFTWVQLRYARWQLNGISFKGPGKNGRWFWILPFDNRSVPAQPVRPKTSKATKHTENTAAPG